MKQKIFVLLCCILFSIQASQVIILMGPSCAGKSTLSKYLHAAFIAKNEAWAVVDFDKVEESIERLIATTHEYLEKNINVIIDTNTYENEIDKKCNGAATKIIIVTAPLDILLQRDEKRTQRLKRSEHRATQCRHFVISSFNESLTWPSDLIIDSSQQSAQEACNIILDFLKAYEIPNL